ncbi:MAG: GntP family permease [Cytophagales bacterium]|nr:GntP family permease [Cytophagales bacterium]
MLTILFILVSVAFLILTTTWLKLHPFLALILTAFLFGTLSGLEPMIMLKTINEGFGKTIEGVGIVIIAGIIIGAFLENSGGAQALAKGILRLIGSKRVHSAMGAMGFIVSIPVFADSGFIILNSLQQALAKKAGVSAAGTAVALAMGLLATHTMVPPTPGPVAAAGILEADLGLVIMFGLTTGIFALIPTIWFARRFGNSMELSRQDEPESQESELETPSLGLSLLPIVIPILLIVLKSIAEYPTAPFGSGSFVQACSFVGHPIIALFVGILFSMLLPKKLEKDMLSVNGWVGKALKEGTIVLLITGAGGAFGKVLQSANIGAILEQQVGASGMALGLAFLLSAGLKTAQGSSTVALITTASIMAPLMSVMGIESGVDKALLVVAIGAGAPTISHANDSFFWVVTQMTGMNVKQGYQLHSLASAILGLTSLLIIGILSIVF